MKTQPHFAHGLRRTLPMLACAAIFMLTLLAVLGGPELAQAAIRTIAPPATADFTATGEQIGNNYGFSVAPAGDINGDGYADVIVGANIANKAYIYTGTVNGLSLPAFFTITHVFTITQISDQFGYVVAGGGDIDANGADDVLIGAPTADVNTVTREVGLVFVYTGTVDGLPTLAVTLTGEIAEDEFGHAADIAGDVNNDGYADVVVGAWQYGLEDAGRIYLYHGGPTGVTNTVNLSITGEAAGDGFGVSVAGAGDVNGDGYDDILVGAWQNAEGGPEAGKAYVYFGAKDGITVTNPSMVTGTTGERLGTSVSSAGDVNGDGYADVIIGSDTFNAITPTPGLMRVYLGSPAGLAPTPQLIKLGETDSDRYGFVVNGGGDLNGDGFDDVAVGAYLFDTTTFTDTGKAYIYAGCYGGVQPSPIFTATGEYDNDNYGHAVALVGDVNQDGLADVLVGAHGGKQSQGGFPISTGKVYGYQGAPVGTCEPQLVLTKTIGVAGYAPLCGENSALTVPTGTAVTYCYQVHNSGDITLTHHLIDDMALEVLQIPVSATLAPGMNVTYVVTHTPSFSATFDVTWTGRVSITAPGGAPTLPPGRYISTTATTSATIGISPSSLDQDNDGTPDNEEGAGDADNDGIPAYLDPDEFPAPTNPHLFLPYLDK